MGKHIDAEWIRNIYADFEHYENRDDWTTPITNVLAVIDDAPSVRCKCDFGKCHEQGDTLYESSDWDGGIGFDYIRDIKYCPLCGGLLDGEEQTEVCIRPDQDCKACWKNQICEIKDKETRERIRNLINDRKSNRKE